MDVGGLERVVLDLVSQGRLLGQSPTVICLERPGALAVQVESAGARVVSLDKGPGIRAEILAQLRTTLKQLRPDVVHTHQIGGLFYAGLASLETNLPLLVHTEHGATLSKACAAACLVESPRITQRDFSVSQLTLRPTLWAGASSHIERCASSPTESR